MGLPALEGGEVRVAVVGVVREGARPGVPGGKPVPSPVPFLVSAAVSESVEEKERVMQVVALGMEGGMLGGAAGIERVVVEGVEGELAEERLPVGAEVREGASRVAVRGVAGVPLWVEKGGGGWGGRSLIGGLVAGAGAEPIGEGRAEGGLLVGEEGRMGDKDTLVSPSLPNAAPREVGSPFK